MDVNLARFDHKSIARSDATGRARAKAAALAYSRSLRDQLLAKFRQSNAPVWVAVQNRGEEVPPRSRHHRPP